MTNFTYYLERANYYDLCELSFDPSSIKITDECAPRTIQSGDTSVFRSVINAAIEKIQAFSGAKEEETQKVVDTVINTFEVIPLVLQDLSVAETHMQVVSALLRAFKMITRMNVITSTGAVVTTLFDKVKELSFRLFTDRPTRADYNVIQSGEFDWVIAGARQVINGYKGIKNSLFVQKFHTLLNYLLSFGLFQSFGLTFDLLKFSEFEAKKIRREYASVEAFALSLVDTVVWTLERGMQATKLGSFEPFFHSSETYAKWAIEASRVCEDSLKMGSAETLMCPMRNQHTDEERTLCERCVKYGDLDEHKFSARLSSTLDQGEAMVKFCHDGDEKRNLQKMLRELRLVDARYNSKDRAQRDRKPPFSLLIFGDSSVGKTMFMNICFMQYAKVHGKDASPECMWTRNPLDKFYSGYKPSKWCVRIDDIAMFNPNATPLDPSIADVILLSNGVTFVAPMAEAEEKGVIPVRPDLLLASTNTEHLNAQAYFSCPVAVRRRFPYVVELSVKDEFCIEGSTMLDAAKVTVDPNEYQDVWNIKLKKLTIVPGQTGPVAEFAILGEFTDIYDFTKVYSDLTLTHQLTQTRAEETASNMRKIDICSKCYMPARRCQCEEVQTSEQDWSAESEGDWFEPGGEQQDHVLAHERAAMSSASMALARRRYDELLVEIRNATVTAYPPREDEMISMRSPERIRAYSLDTDSVYSEDLSDEELDEILSRRQTYLQKAGEWVNDTTSIVYTIAKSLAGGVSRSVWRVADEILAKASDLMLLYQVKKFQTIMSSLGKKLYDTFSDWRIVGFCALVVALWGAWKMVSMVAGVFFTDVQSTNAKNEESKERTVADFDKDEKPNPWLKEEIILSDFQVPSKSRGWQSLALGDVQKRLRNNVVHTSMEWEDATGVHHIPSVSTCVAGHVYMTNNHCIPKVPTMTCYMSQEPSTGNLGKNIKFVLSQPMVFRIPEKDIAFFWCVLPPKMNTVELFLSRPAPGIVCGGFYIHCRKDQFPEVNNVQAIRSQVETVGTPINCQMRIHHSVPDRDTIHGDCGSPLIGMTTLGPVILGIHQSWTSFTHEAGATEVLSTDIEQAVQFFGTQVQCGVPSLITKVGLLHQKSVLRWPNKGQGMVYGSTPEGSWRSAPKSKVVDTVICEEAIKEGFVKRCQRPAMAGPEVWFNNIEPTVTQEFKLDKGMMDMCVDGLVRDIQTRLTQEDLDELIALDDKSTMNGFPGVKFIDKINRQTSMGYPHRKSKQNYLVPVAPDAIYSDAVDYTPVVWDEINKIRETYTRGERYMPVFSMSLKDEPVPEEKVRIKKTRGFMGGPAAWQFVMRQQLLTFVRVFQKNPEIFEGAPGLNCNSCQWRHMEQYLTKFGKNTLFSGDYKKYDKSMDPMVILAAFTVISKILRSAGRPELDLLFVKCIAEDVAYPLTMLQGDLIEFLGSNPSGHALTVIINCIVNSLYMRYVFLELSPDHSLDTFKDLVALLTYGDDNAVGVSPEAPWFNHTTVSKCMAKYGITYTMADKKSESVPYIRIDQISFLKRSFSELEGRLACPLEWASIDKMLTTCVASRSVCPEEQALQSIRSAVGEFFQYGREVYEANVAKMKRIVHNCGLEAYVQQSTFPTYAELLEAHREAGKNCAVCKATAEKSQKSACQNLDTVIQSEVVDAPLTEDSEAIEVQHENVTYEEAPILTSVDLSVPFDESFLHSNDEAASLGKYLERPVRIHTFKWLESEVFNYTPTTFYPWEAYFSNSYIKNKLQNFSRVRCKLHLTFRFNASPFYYGSLRASYDPLATGKFDPITVNDMVSISQTPGVYIEPQEGSVVEMTLPFLYYDDWLDTKYTQRFHELGKIFYCVYAQLRSANGVTGTGITVTVYARALDVEVAGPTIATVLQSGIISGPASAVATAASAYTSHAKIGPYAKAVKVGATLVSTVAKMFGFSNPPVMDDVRPVQNKVFHAFANVETSMPIDKLALDPKNEVTLDNSVAGVGNEDELDITSIVTRPSYIGAVDWVDTTNVGDRLCFGKVSPSMVPPTTTATGGYLNPTPAGWVAEMFRYWRGGMKYHFKVVRSKYQKGRLMFNWDPNGVVNTANPETALFTKIFDLASPEDGFDVVIPYKASSPWLRVSNVNYFALTVPNFTQYSANGNWQLTCVNQLTGPALANTVTIMCYASACEDMEFAAPRALGNYYYAQIQSAPMDGSALSESDSHISEFTMGERIGSLRTVLHRTSLSLLQSAGVQDAYTSFGAGRWHTANHYYNIPPEPGFTNPADDNGFNKAKGGLVPGTIKEANFSKMHPINYVLGAFAGYRGSVNVHAVVDTNGLVENLNTMSITRIDHSPIIDSSKKQTNSIANKTVVSDPVDIVPSTGIAVDPVAGLPYVPSGIGGMTVTHGRTQMALSANIPQYCPARFWPAWHAMRYSLPVLGLMYDGFRVDLDFFIPESTVATTLLSPTIKLYWSTGVDFNTVFFTGVPRLYQYSLASTV